MVCQCKEVCGNHFASECSKCMCVSLYSRPTSVLQMSTERSEYYHLVSLTEVYVAVTGLP